MFIYVIFVTTKRKNILSMKTKFILMETNHAFFSGLYLEICEICFYSFGFSEELYLVFN